MWFPHITSSEPSLILDKIIFSKKHSEHVSFPCIYTVPHCPQRIKTCQLLSDDLWIKIKIFNPTHKAELGPYFCLQCHLEHTPLPYLLSLSYLSPCRCGLISSHCRAFKSTTHCVLNAFHNFFLLLNFSSRWLFLKAHSRIVSLLNILRELCSFS